MSMKQRIIKLESFKKLADTVAVITELIGGGFEYKGRVFPTMDEAKAAAAGARVFFCIPEKYPNAEAWGAAMEDRR